MLTNKPKISDRNMGFQLRIAELSVIHGKAITKSLQKKEQKSTEADTFGTGLLYVCIRIMGWKRSVHFL